MARIRISTTVDGGIFEEVRRRRNGATNAKILDEALQALLAHDRATEIDEQYARAYDELPLDTEDEWGDLASFRSAAAAS